MEDMMRLLFVTAAIFACRDSSEKTPTYIDGQLIQDEDEDGFVAADDCNDNIATIFPNAEEICDGIDNNCDGQIDEGVLISFYADADGDGFGNVNIVQEACAAPEGFILNTDDCNDVDANSHPGAEEICDGLDNNCDAAIDEGLMSTFYADNDGDGFGDENNPIEACILTEGLSIITGDCDDSDSAISPVAEEVCDERDNNCNAEVDEGVIQTWYPDLDVDGYGDEDNGITTCTPPEGYITRGGDCDDLELYANPLMLEICDNMDNDCDGSTDEPGAYGEQVFYEDSDGDGQGNLSVSMEACAPPVGYVSSSSDCDDGNNAVFLGAVEYCNSQDDDCDGDIDESAVDMSLWYLDFDGDGVGNPSYSLSACSAPSGYVASDADCDDTDVEVNPTAAEICDGIDNDCDGAIDSADTELDSAVTTLYYLDNDEDGYGDPNHTAALCSLSTGYSENALDCDDSNASIYPEPGGGCGLGTDCLDILDNGLSTGDGLYSIDLDGFGNGTDPFDVWCDMTIDGGGWTRISRFAPYSNQNFNTVNYLSSISSSSFSTTPDAGNWMVAYPHQDLIHSEVLINNDSTSNWIIHNNTDNGWTSSFLGTGGTYPSNEPQSVHKTSWGTTEAVYWWCESVNCHENINFSTTGCNDLAIPIDDSCSGTSSTHTFLSIR